MHIVVIFHNVGGYHAARLRSAQSAFQNRGWTLTVIQETDNAHEHPWGNIEQEINFPLKTLLPIQEFPDIRQRHPQSSLAAKLLPACLQEIKPDVLAIPGWGYPISRAALRWAQRRNLPAILMSDSKRDDAPRQWWKEKLKSLLYVRQFQAALVAGTLHQDYLIDLSFPKANIFQGYDIVDNDYFTAKASQARQEAVKIRQQYPKIPTRSYFVSVTRFISRKNVLRLLDAYIKYRQLVGADVAWDLVICGNGQEEDNIKAHIQHKDLTSYVHLPGFQTYQVIPFWFGLASAFIHPALSEQWGLVVNEALAAGLPVLVSNRCGCYPELVIEGVNGFGFDPKNIEQVAYLMQQLSNGKVDLAQMSKASISHIQKFSPASFGKGLEQAIDCAINTKTKKSADKVAY